MVPTLISSDQTRSVGEGGMFTQDEKEELHSVPDDERTSTQIGKRMRSYHPFEQIIGECPDKDHVGSP